MERNLPPKKEETEEEEETSDEDEDEEEEESSEGGKDEAGYVAIGDIDTGSIKVDKKKNNKEDLGEGRRRSYKQREKNNQKAKHLKCQQ
uniref:Uncharacterized protein n=1 Tax=Meloidogyne enterolobii TaxID=390850 RepID=A0A6V7YCZ4_MELEN|nr:unnamed protein product [Meloidogyne enterolobii]